MEAVAAVGEAFLSTMFSALLDKFSAADLINFAQKEKVYTEFKKWKKILENINAVLTDAEEKQVTNRTVNIWLTDLRDLAYEIEDVLDLFAYEVWRRKSTAEPPASTSEVKMFLPTCLSGLKLGTVSFSATMGSKIKEISTRLQEIATRKNDLELSENVGVRKRYQRQPTTSVVNEVNVFGRKIDKEAILKLLLAEKTSDVKLPVIPITGMAGIGKTTLAQLVYNDKKVKDFFNLKAWIYVSEDFDVIKVTKAILQAVTSRACEMDDLDLLHLKLKEELSGKTFLLVLDDVWHESYIDWSQFISPFEDGDAASKIIITTRNQDVSQITGTIPAYPLKELSNEDCLSVLACHALKKQNFDEHAHLKEIGEEIVKRCKGLPMAVKTLAGVLLTKKTYREWEAVSRSKMWDLTEVKGGVFPALKLSYHHLPSHLKPCFAYCSLFPKGFEFDRDELVLLWMAEGFLQQKRNTKLEDLGRNYFSDLLSRSFFQLSKNNTSLFVMHDLINDLAQSVAGDSCLNMEHEQQIHEGQHYFEKARHVSFICHQYDVLQRFEILNKMTSLRSFLALPSSHRTEYCYLTRKVSLHLLPKLKCLRVLSLSGYFVGELSNSIGNLKHLRYLNLSKTAISLLPKSVGKLHHLQTLILKQCKKLAALPVEIGRLIKLQYLDISETPELQQMPSRLGNLTSLQVLSKFIVGKAAGGLKLRDLKHLSLLQGQLSISGLHAVKDIQDARIANLKQKRNLKELALEWSNDLNHIGNKHDQFQILEFLHPPKDLEGLSISYYADNKFPSWIGHPSLAKIVQLYLSDCKYCTSLPALGRLPLLRELSVKGMSSVTILGQEFSGEGSPVDKVFPSLKLLKFENMAKWKIWTSATNIEVFPLLHELILHNCPKLSGSIPRNLHFLVRLDVQKCPQLTNSPLSYSCLGELNIEDCSYEILRSVVDLSSVTKLKLRRISDLPCLTNEVTRALVKLEVLEIEDCSELKCLWSNGSEADNLPWLKTLVIKNCPQLVSLVGEKQELCCLSSLKDLRIESCNKFVSFPATGLPRTLKCLKILYCDALESLPDAFEILIEELEIVGCPLKSFPEDRLPLALKSLSMVDCRKIQFPPVGMVPHDDKKNIAPHLEYLRVDNCQTLTLNLEILHFLQKLTSLRVLSLCHCKALKFIPLGGLPPNLTSLEFQDCENLNQPMAEWGLEKLDCLKEIKIFGACPAADMVSFPTDEGVMLPSSLTRLWLENLQNLESLSRRLENLDDLKELLIRNCPKLRYLPKTGLPPSLGRFSISGCPILQEKCRKKRGEFCPLFFNIPCLEID